MEFNHYSGPRGHYYNEPEHQQEHHCHPSSLPPYPYSYGGYAHTNRKMVFQPIIPHDNDILMGRGGKNNQHCGNEKLRQLARLEAREYHTSSKKGKSRIAKGLVTKVRQMQPAGRFLKRNPVTSDWEDVGNEYAREKASQVLRDAVALLPEIDGGSVHKEKRKEREPYDIADDEPELATEHCESNVATLPVPELAFISSEQQASLMVPNVLKRQHFLAAPNHRWQSLPFPPTPETSHKRQRPNHFFERSAFFASHGKNDSLRSLGTFPETSPSPSRRGSLTGASAVNRGLASTAASAMSRLPSNNHARDENEAPEALQSLERDTSDEFGYDFY